MSGIFDRIIDFISDTKESYEKGIERFGVWWKVLMLSLIALIIFFILLAIVIAVLFL